MLRRRLIPLLLTALAVGCGKGPVDSAEPAEVKHDDATTRDHRPAVPERSPAEPRDRLHQAFADAVQVNPREARPLERTMTGKSVEKLCSQVVGIWDKIRFTRDNGKPLLHQAVIETEMGLIVIDLDSERAPNHVRHFIALAHAGYFDGLTFDTVRQTEGSSPSNARCEELEVGCPIPSGDRSVSNLGFRLKPEIDRSSMHEEGTVSVCRDEEGTNAACKFRIGLVRSPELDGTITTFGKVASGMDVLKKIADRPTILREDDIDDARRPLEPVVVRRVNIRPRR